MGAKAKRGAAGSKGIKRAPVQMTGCLHTNAMITVAGDRAPLYRVMVHCSECGRSELLTDRDAGSILALIGGR